jgi:hypothetical protein
MYIEKAHFAGLSMLIQCVVTFLQDLVPFCLHQIYKLEELKVPFQAMKKI